MKDIIKEVLNENTFGGKRLERIDYVDSNDLRMWKAEGLYPYIFIDNGGSNVEFREVKSEDLSPLKKKNLAGTTVYLLTDVQLKYAQKLAAPIVQKIILSRSVIEKEKQLFTGILVQKFMKNDFGKMTIDDKSESDEPIT